MLKHPLDKRPGESTIMAVSLEVECARIKFPRNRHLTVALMEEVGELARAQLQGKPRDEIYREAKQVAAVAIRIMEETDDDFRDGEKGAP